MANVFADLPVPAGDGTGAPVDTSLFAARKTVNVVGNFVSAITIEISEDGTDWAPLHTFTNQGKRTLYCAAAWMRVRQSGWIQGTANVDVAADRADGQFSAMNVPAADGAGVALDVSIFPEFFTFIVAGAFTGGLIIEMSEDGTSYAPVLGFSNIGPKNTKMTAYRVRVRRTGTDPALPGTPTVTVGAVDPESSSAGGVVGTAFVFRPGGVPGVNVYTTWPTLMADLVLVDGPKVIEFDDSIVTPCVIPAPTVPGTPYDITNCVLTGRGYQDANYLSFTEVEISDGVSFTGFREVRHQLRIRSRATASPVVVTGTPNGEYFYLSDNVDIGCLVGAAPFFSLSPTPIGGLAVFVLSNRAFLAHIDHRTVIGDVATGRYLWLVINDACLVGRAAIATDVGSTTYVELTSTSSYFDGAQTALLGAMTPWQSQDQAFSLSPEPGIVPSVVPVTAITGNFIRLNATAGAITQPLPSIAVTSTSHRSFGRWIAIKETSGINGVIVDANGAQTINGALTYTIPPGGAAMFISDGVSNWTTIGIDMNHVLNRLNTFTKAQGTAQVNLPDNVAGITPDLTLSNSHQCNLGAVAGNTRQLGVPTGAVAGFTYFFEFVQPAGPTAVQALTYDATWWKFPGGVIPALTATNDAKDILTFYYDGTAMLCVSQLNFRNP